MLCWAQSAFAQRPALAQVGTREKSFATQRLPQVYEVLLPCLRGHRHSSLDAQPLTRCSRSTLSTGSCPVGSDASST
jgi:hypothetical protein